MQFESIVFIQPTLAHYHYPRMQAFGEYCREVGVSFYCIELASYMETYLWDVENPREQFIKKTLFPGQILENIPAKKVWSALKSKLEELDPDVVFIYGYYGEVMRRAKLWAEGGNVATVLISDSNAFDKRRWALIEFFKSLFVYRFDAAFVGGTSSSLYLQKLGIPKERIIHGYDVIDTAFFSDRAVECKKNLSTVRQKWNLPENYFLVVARLVKEKNLPRLLNAYEEYVLRTERELDPWKLVICGSGPEEGNLRSQVKELPGPIRERIILYGYVKQPEVIDFFSGASCLVLPSISESWGLVVNEAMACGIPVIVSQKAGCASDLVQNHVNGWTFNPYDVNELVKLMIHVTQLDEARRNQMGQCGKDLISAWGLERYVEGTLESARIALAHRSHWKTRLRPGSSLSAADRREVSG